MFLLDTNVISELMELEPAPQVAAWWTRHKHSGMYISAIARAETEYGVFRLPEGKKKAALAAAAERVFRACDDWCFPFDENSVAHFAAAKDAREKAGKPPKDADMMIAAIALQHRLTLATRNARDFSEIGLKVVNPWD